MRRLFVALMALCAMTIAMAADNIIYKPRIKSLQAVVNQDWLSPAVMTMGSDDVLRISFDELSHEYHRFVYRIEHCEADWSVSQDIFGSDWLEGFNNIPIEDYKNSLNTTVLYTHYKLEIPNERCRLKMSGNYKLTIIDEDNDNEEVAEVRFRVAEQLMSIDLTMTTNTDIDINNSHQQLGMKLNYGQQKVINHQEEIFTLITQNNQTHNAKINIPTTLINGRGLEWRHNRQLIFNAGNEYRKFEVLALSHATMGIDYMRWDGHNYHAYPFVCEPRKNYLTDEDANGAFYIRNSDNFDNDFTCDYVYVHYKLKSPYIPDAELYVDGEWTTAENKANYKMHYDENDGTYNATILQKQGYYSFQYIMKTADGHFMIPPTEGNFYQTENRYQAYVYYKPTGARTWRLVAYRQIQTE
ncbi:MAG: DUF5103 domain-containing protein [Prevotella sp.]|nr:DUF5103 domain-containing protein [Prevotella sp.]